MWIKTSNTNTGVIKIVPRASSNIFGLKIESNKFQWGDGSWHDVGIAAQSNTWYHIQIEFETTTGNYKDLDQWKWRVYIDSEQFGDYGFQLEEVPTKIMLISGESSNGYNAYFDAIGCTWDPNYDAGDNQEEGIFLDFDSSVRFNWTGYSLKGQLNQTITGDTVIPYPESGNYNIQVFGNDSNGNWYQSDLRYFNISDFTNPSIEGLNKILVLEQFSGYNLQWNITDIGNGIIGPDDNLFNIFPIIFYHPAPFFFRIIGKMHDLFFL